MKTQIQIDTMSTITGTFFTLTDWSTKTEHNISTEEAEQKIRRCKQLIII